MKKTILIVGCFAVLLAALTALIFFVSQRALLLERELESKEIPEGRSAADYFALGQRFKDAGWPERSRKALFLAEKIDPQGVGIRAKRFRLARLPHTAVPDEAVQMNIAGYNSSDDEKAEKIWKDCIEKYPDFEWPYCNLAAKYLAANRLAEAEPLFKKALSLNPQYSNALCGMSELEIKRDDKAAAKVYLDRALAADPENPRLESVKSQF